VSVLKEIHASQWGQSFSTETQACAITAIESGKIVFFSQLPFQLTLSETRFLSPQYADSKAKNISFNQQTGLLRCGACSSEEHADLKKILQRYAQYAQGLIQNLLPAYTNAIKIARTSYRPVEIAGRTSSYRKDDTRLHVDAFPATPNQGQRILRVFTNINPHGQARVWRVGEPFEAVARRFLPAISRPWFGKAALLKALKITKTYRTEYDHIMLQMHDRMKADLDYQKNVPQVELRLAPGSTWIVQTDHVSHAAMQGQYVLEQTFYLPVAAMQEPALSPLRTLERMTGRILI
jgi:hypothetical protein